MMQRTILRASRQAARRTPAFAPLRQQIGITRVAATPALRWYSDAAPAAKEGEAAEKKEDTSNTEAAKLKEQLEKKDKEIVELKVRLHAHFTARSLKVQQLIILPGQIPTLSSRLPQLARAYETRDASRQRLRHPTLRPRSRRVCR